MGKGLQRTVLTVLFLVGLAIFSYPYAQVFRVKREMESTVQFFQEQKETQPTTSVMIPDSMQPSEQRFYPELWEDMTAYNESIFAQRQSGLSCKLDYQQPSFRLADYGLKEEVFGFLTIPAMELEMPIYLGATDQHMADGAAHLSQTSLPIGGANTNSVIAGHRGYGGASYFRYIDKLQIGDTVTVTNLWGQLTYRVAEIKIIYPCEFAERMQQNGVKTIPLRSSLPDKCFGVLESTGEMIVIAKGEKGYTPTGIYPQDTSPREGVTAANAANGVTKAQEAAMVAGSMFGWDTPAADPKNYDEQGVPIRPKAKDRSER